MRMGTDKGLLAISGKAWAAHVGDLLGAVVPRVVLSVNAQQADRYRTAFPDVDCVVDDGRLPIGGPLLGLLTVHLQYPSANLLVLACDMVAMRAALLQRLMRHFADKPCAALVFEHCGYPQPLCGLYAAQALAGVARRAAAADLTNYSMMHMLGLVGATKLFHGAEYDDCFGNYNHPDNLQLRRG